MNYGVSLPSPKKLAGAVALGAPRASVNFCADPSSPPVGAIVPRAVSAVLFATLIYFGGHCYPLQFQLISTPERFAGEAGERTVR